MPKRDWNTLAEQQTAEIKNAEEGLMMETDQFITAISDQLARGAALERELQQANRVIALLVDRLGGYIEVDEAALSAFDKKHLELIIRRGVGGFTLGVQPRPPEKGHV